MIPKNILSGLNDAGFIYLYAFLYALLEIEIDNNDKHTLYPNPSNGKCHLFLSISNPTEIDIELYDELGKNDFIFQFDF